MSNKMKKLISILMIFAGASLFASLRLGAAGNEKSDKFKPVTPVMDSIKTHIQDPYSNYYYKRLWRKYWSNDTNMSMQEYRHLYLGYVFQEDYNPYRQSEFSKKIQPLYYKQSHSAAECDTIIKYAELSLADDPFDLNQMKFFIYALREKKKFARAAIWQFRLNHLVQAILSTGTGQKDSPWVVINPAHEYNIVNLMGLVATEHREYEGDIDYILVDQPKGRKVPEGYYFDVSNVLRMYNLKFQE